MSAQEYLSKLTYAAPDRNPDERLRQMILYIADQCVDDPTFGATKLNKILYFADFWSFRDYHESITGCAYMRLDEGPVPVRLLPVREKMLQAGEIAIARRKVYNLERQPVVALREASLDCFKARDIAMEHTVIQWLWGVSAHEASDRSHGRVWKMMQNKERVPYESIFISDEPLTAYDIARSKELALKYGWDT